MPHTRWFTGRLAVVLATSALALAACRELQAPSGDPPTVELPFIAAFTDFPDVSEVVVTVSGPRIDPPLVFNFSVVNDTARGDVTLPVGSDRLIVAQGFDSTGTEILRGQRSVSVLAGSNPAVAIVMMPLTGSLPVTAVIGSVSISLVPAAASVRAGSTLALTADVRDATDAVIAVPVRFAVSRPPAAFVGDDSVLVALDTGSVTVTATAFGRAASTTISITAGSVLEGLTMLPDSLIGDGVSQAVVAIFDDIGVDSVRLNTAAPSGAAGPSCASAAPLRGTRLAGDFACNLVFSAGAELGRWPITSLHLYSGANVAVLDSMALRHRGAAAAVRIVP